jgi:hypothetical protein
VSCHSLPCAQVSTTFSKSGFLKNGSACIAKCTSASTCPKTANGTAVCTTSTGACSIKCASGYKLSGGLCVKTCTAASTCPTITNGTKTCVSGLCGFTCKTGYVKSGATCVLSCPSGTKLSGGKCVKTCTAASTCPVVANANPTVSLSPAPSSRADCLETVRLRPLRLHLQVRLQAEWRCLRQDLLGSVSGPACRWAVPANRAPARPAPRLPTAPRPAFLACAASPAKPATSSPAPPASSSPSPARPLRPAPPHPPTRVFAILPSCSADSGAQGKAVCTSGFCKVQCNAKYILSPAGNSCIAVQCTSNSHCTSPPTNGEGGVVGRFARHKQLSHPA